MGAGTVAGFIPALYPLPILLPTHGRHSVVIGGNEVNPSSVVLTLILEF